MSKSKKIAFNASPPKSFMKDFQIRWNEALGDKECPYAFRWVFMTPWFSIRIHKWIRSDDSRYMHDHSWDFTTFILKGYYYDVSDKGRIKRDRFNFYNIPATHAHYVEIPISGCTTIVFSGKPKRKWGFWVDGKFKRPLKYFHKYGHPPCDEQ